MGCASSSPASVAPGPVKDHNNINKKNGSSASSPTKPKSHLGTFLSKRSIETNPHMEARVKEALKAIIMDRERKEKGGNLNPSASFNRIILKFPAIRRAFISIHAVFREFDSDNSGTIDARELLQCMHALGAKTMTEEGVKEMFNYAIIPKEHRKKSFWFGKSSSSSQKIMALTFKEFLLSLAIGSVLQLFPLLRAYSAIDLTKYVEPGSLTYEGNTGSNPHSSSASSLSSTAPSSPHTEPSSPSHAEGNTNNRRRASDEVAAAAKAAKVAVSNVMNNKSSSTEDPATSDSNPEPFLLMQGRHLVNALKLVLEAYILFDNDGSGSIDRNEVLRMIDEENRKVKAASKKKGGEIGTSALLSKERWLELDWDSDGQITFKEFLFALFTWVGIDDDDNNDMVSPVYPEGNIVTDINQPGRRVSGASSVNNAGNVTSTSASTPKTELSTVDQEIDSALQLPPRSMSIRANEQFPLHTGVGNTSNKHIPPVPPTIIATLVNEHDNTNNNPSSSNVPSSDSSSSSSSSSTVPVTDQISMNDLTAIPSSSLSSSSSASPDPSIVVPFIHSTPLNHHDNHHHNPNASVRFSTELDSPTSP